MPRFRARSPRANRDPINTESVRELIAEMFRPAHLFAAAELLLEWEHVASEELAWEIFQGRLLDAAHTRERHSFEAWNVYQTTAREERASEPLLSLKLDVEARRLYVVRGLDSYVWEGYDAGGNVYMSRERRKWVRELVGTIHLDRFADVDELTDELACQLFQAVVGSSRLPLSSVETPLPAFSFGWLFYCYRPAAPQATGPLRTWRELIADMLAPSLNRREQAHLLETFLHDVPSVEMTEATGAFVARWSELDRSSGDLPALLRTLFNEVSLSPYTDLVEKTLTFLHALEDGGHFQTDQVVDFLSYLLRHIGRHLTAYDLIVFHHRGANYPDALLLDAVLKEYLACIERRPLLFFDATGDGESARRQKRLRRRALRQGWLLRRRYEGHPVPDLPTSPGENMRVLPPSHPRVPEEQIAQPARRSRRLHDGDPLNRRLGPQTTKLLRQSLLDLEHADEWRELGLAIFLDRPLGVGKAASEPDGILLLSAEAFSVSIARERLYALARDLGLQPADEEVQCLLAHSEVRGLPLDAIGGAVRPGIVSLVDARRASADFVFLRSTPSCVRTFLTQYDFTPLTRRFRVEDMLDGSDVLIARSAVGMGIVLYDSRLRPRIELEVANDGGYEIRAGHEYSLEGLRVMHVWETTHSEGLQAYDLRNEPMRLLSFDAATSPAAHPDAGAEDRRDVGAEGHRGAEEAVHLDAGEEDRQGGGEGDHRDVGEGDRRDGPAAGSRP
jgi:hypothetical protein